MPVDLHPHQVEGVAKMHNGCILYGDVGVGKTITSLAYYYERVCGGTLNKWASMTTPKDVYVITTAKVRDDKGFELQAAVMGVFNNPELSTNGVKITVDSWNNLHKYVEVKDAFFIFDEQRVVGYGAWSRAFIKVAKSNEWILLSATPGDTWLDYIPVFIANGWYKHKTDFLDQHVIWTPRVKYPKVLRYQNVGKLVRHRNEILVRMPYARHTVRHPVDIWCEYDTDAFERVTKKRWHVYEDRPIRDVAELFSVMRKVVNSDSSRLSSVEALLSKHPKLIVFYNFDYELEMLRELGQSLSTTSGEVGQRSTNTESSKVSLSGTKPSPSTLSEPEINHSKGTPNSSSESPSAQQPLSKSLSNGQSVSSNDLQSLSGTRRGKKSPSSGKSSSNPGSKQTERPGANTSHTSTTTTTTPSSTPSVEAAAPSSMQPKTFAFAEWNGHNHQEIPKTDRWLYLVQYRAGAEGWNCVETDAICFFSQTYSYRDWWQSHGRIDRLNTPFIDLWYYHLVSRSLIDKAIRKALRAKKTFNERSLDLKVA